MGLFLLYLLGLFGSRLFMSGKCGGAGCQQKLFRPLASLVQGVCYAPILLYGSPVVYVRIY